MKNLLLPIFVLLLCNYLSSQEIWKDFDATQNTSPRKYRLSYPSEYRTVTFDLSVFLNEIREAPLRTNANAAESDIILSFPLPNGQKQSFRLVDAELMHSDLAAKFPELQAWIGKGIDDPTADLRINYSPYHGFNGMIRSGNHATVYIDPLTEDHNLYMVYDRDHVTKVDEGFQCHTEGADEAHGKQRITSTNSSSRYGDCNLRRYRLAQSCTGEYAQYHITQAGGTTGTTAGDKAIVQSAMNVTMNRVNGVYELDLGITMQFIANNDDIIYLNGGTDPWTNEWNTKTAQTIDAQIGVANYDIGHNFNDTGGGNAGCLTCICTSTSQTGTHKGRGYTGRAAPVGDPFDIDYVAHEMGHQFGGYHTQSNSSCRSGSGATEVETGSGSTIMGYAGICAANVQNQSDDYFHYVNIRDIVDAINNGVQNTCAELIPSGNTSPVADAGANYTIPVSTAFKLTGTGSDANDVNLTYCWEQNDPENHNSNASPPSNRTVGPMFRSFDPVAVPYRYFPSLNEIIAGNLSPTWEMIPTVSRTMDFAFTVRDNNLNSGCTAFGEMTVTTDAGSGPFLVTVPNTNLTWNAGDTETVTWDVAGTDNAPVNCANVDILLSTDGGLTYPSVIASNVPNDGSQAITVPGTSGSNNRILIRCSDNIFFDISNQNFSINLAGPVVNFSSTALGTIDEGTSCGTKTLAFDLIMDTAPVSNVTVNLGLTGTANQGTDYDINASSFVFTPTDWMTPKNVVITIYEDGTIENEENIIVEMASVTGANAVKGLNGLLTFNIMEDDKDPATSGALIATTIFSEDFEGGFPAGWSRTGSAQVFVAGTVASLSSQYWTIPNSNSTQLLASNDDDCDCDMSNEILESAPFTVNSTMTTVNALMDIYLTGGLDESGELQLSQDGGGTFPTLISLSIAAAWQNLDIDLSSYIPASGSESWVLRWKYNDNADWAYGFAIDNISVQASFPDASDIQTTMNVASGYAEQNLGAGEIVHFYDQITGDIMCTIDNSASSHDYGCTRVEVDRQGTNSVGFTNPLINTFLHAKTFKITPTTNTSSDVGYTIHLYYTDAEVTGWEAITAESRNLTYLYKTDGNNKISDVTANNPSNIPISSQVATYGTFGSNNHVYTASFTNGFSGFGIGILDSNTSNLPVELLFFKGKYVDKLGNQLDWLTSSEKNTEFFEVQRSTDSHNFEKIGKVTASGNSLVNLDYQFLDRTPENGVNYYRLRIVDTDGSFEYSNVVAISGAGLDFDIRPNPTKENVILGFNIPLTEEVNIQILDMSGRTISNEFRIPNDNNEILIGLNHLPVGTYFIRVISGNDILGKKVVRY